MSGEEESGATIILRKRGVRMRKRLTHETGILDSSDSSLGWVFSLVLDCLNSEVIKLNLSGIEPLCVL